MMISPESYVEFNLKNKSRDEVFKSIEKLRKELRKLKKVIDKNEPKDFMICPSPEVQYSVSLDYLAAARKYVESQGWEYVPSKEEVIIDEFNEKISNISKIELKYTAFMHGSETRTLSFDGEKIVTERHFEGGFIHEHYEEWESWYEDMERSSIIETILDYRMYDWPAHYNDVDVMDGYCWELKFKFSDGSKDIIFDGMNEISDSMLDLLDALGMRDLFE